MPAHVLQRGENSLTMTDKPTSIEGYKTTMVLFVMVSLVMSVERRIDFSQKFVLSDQRLA